MVRAWVENQAIPPLRQFMLESLQKRLPEELRLILAAVADGDLEQLAFVSHRVKGWTGTYGMMELSELAGEIERLANAGDLGAAGESAHELERVIGLIPQEYLQA